MSCSWSWSATEEDVRARRREADGLVGRRIRSVRYFTLDYLRYELRPDLMGSGPRTIQAEDELAGPTWSYDGFDALDYGLELVTDSAHVYSLTWDPPGEREGIGVQPVSMLGRGVRQDADIAIWNVGGLSDAWRSSVGSVITRIDLHYVRWDGSGESQWCPHITIRTDRSSVDVVMGDASNGALVPSADNVAVLHPGASLPAWL